MSAGTIALPRTVSHRGRLARQAGSSLAAVLLALVVGGVLIAIAGGDPVSAYSSMIDGALGSQIGVGQVLVVATPLLIIGLGLAVAFRAGVWNIGAEGQLFMGGLAGGALVLLLPIDVGLVLILAAAAVGVAAGAAWGGIVGALRARWGVHEVISSLLLNYVAIYAFTYVVRQPMRDPDALSLQSDTVPAGAALPVLGSLYAHIGILVAVALVPLVGYVLTRAPFGFRVRMLGLNPDAAEAAGVRRARTVIVVMLISGGFAGLAGVFQVLGVTGRLDPTISQDYGFTAIVVALLGRMSATGVLLAALFMAVLSVGGQAMSVAESLNYSIILAIQGVFVVFLLIADRLARG